MGVIRADVDLFPCASRLAPLLVAHIAIVTCGVPHARMPRAMHVAQRRTLFAQPLALRPFRVLLAALRPKSALPRALVRLNQRHAGVRPERWQRLRRL